jgi:hypothetical protein
MREMGEMREMREWGNPNQKMGANNAQKTSHRLSYAFKILIGIMPFCVLRVYPGKQRAKLYYLLSSFQILTSKTINYARTRHYQYSY